jgi:hypothetical protein
MVVALENQRISEDLNKRTLISRYLQYTVATRSGEAKFRGASEEVMWEFWNTCRPVSERPNSRAR